MQRLPLIEKSSRTRPRLVQSVTRPASAKALPIGSRERQLTQATQRLFDPNARLQLGDNNGRAAGLGPVRNLRTGRGMRQGTSARSANAKGWPCTLFCAF